MNYLSDEDYDFIYSRVPRICVDLLIVNSNSEILLTKRTIEPYKDHWHLPGGRIKFRESIFDALNRILKAELGLGLSVVEMIGACEFPEEIQKGQERHSISLVHFIKTSNYTEINLDHTANEMAFFGELPTIIIPAQQKFINENRGRKF